MKQVIGGIALVALGLSACGESSSNSTAPGAGGIASNGGVGAGAGAGGTVSGGSSASGGGGAVSGNAASGGDSSVGATSAGGAAGSDDAGAGGEASNGLGDPKPVEPNLTGLVPTSSQWVLFQNPPTNGALYANDIELLDLASNQLYPANPGGAYDVIGGLSPDGRTYFFSDGDGDRPSDRIIRLEPTGFVPAHQLEGYTGIAGAYRVLSWSQDSRFAVVSRGGAGVEIVDMRLGTRVASESLSSIEGAFAPTGYSYFYYDAQTPMYSPRYARVTQSGSTPVALLPAGATTLTFDTSGTLLFYALGSYPDGYKLYVLSLADGQTRELSIIQDGEVFDGFEIVPAPGNSVIVEIRKLANSQTFLRRVPLDANQAATTITNPAVSAAYIFGSDDPNLLLVTNSDNSLDFIRLEPYARSTLPGTFEFSVDPNTYGIVGHHAYYLANDVLHLVHYADAGALQDIAISAAGEKSAPCTGRFTYTPQQKLAFVQGDGAELVFVDLTTSPPAAVGSFSASATGYKVGCPHWGDSDTALLFGETNGTNGNRYITRWNAAAPEQPKRITQAIGGVLAFMYR